MSDEERFWSRVKKTDRCWLWTGNKNPDGYGMFWLDGKAHGAHRVSWLFHYGEIPKHLFVLHHCDNPACVRPCHLFLGTAGDNSRDSWAKGRGSVHRATSTRIQNQLDKQFCKRGHVLTGTNLYVTPAGARDCRECRRAACTRYMKRKRGGNLEQRSV